MTVTKDLTGFVKLAKASNIPDGTVRTYAVADDSIALCNVDGKFYAIDNVCTHDDGPLGDGTLVGCEVQCPRHGARFDVRTGAVTAMPAAVGVQAYETYVAGEDIYVKLDD